MTSPRVLPFRGYRLRPDGEADAVLAPPYDVLDEAGRARYADRSPSNVVHLTLPRPEEGLEPAAAAARRLAAWRAEGRLRQDDEPSLYVQHAVFRSGVGAERRRLGVVALVEVLPLGPDGILGHERVLPGPLDDRRRLLEATRADLEPVFFLHRRPVREVAAALADARMLDARRAELDGVEFELARVVGGDARRLAGLLSGSTLFVADGHHRHTVSVAARRDHPEEPGARYRLALLVAADDPGLVVAPTHRVVRRLDDEEIAALRAALERAFVIEETPPAALPEALAAGSDPRSFGVALRGGPIGVARPAADAPPPGPPPLDRLDVSWLERRLLDPLRDRGLPLSPPNLLHLRGDGTALELPPRAEDAAAFLLRPPPLPLLLEAAEHGLRLPPKSTYFVPKALSGQVLHLWDGFAAEDDER